MNKTIIATMALLLCLACAAGKYGSLSLITINAGSPDGGCTVIQQTFQLGSIKLDPQPKKQE